MTTVEKANGKVSESYLSVEAILTARDLVEEDVDCPEWGGKVKIRSFTKKAQQEIRDMSTVNDEIDSDRLETFIFLRGVIEPHFTDDQYELLREKSSAVVDRVVSKIMDISGMTELAQKAMEAGFRNKP